MKKINTIVIYFYKYQQMVNDYVIIYHKMYEPEKLKQL